MRRLFAALTVATIGWLPQSIQTAQTVSAVYCWPGDPPAVYQACVDYNNGIGQQVANQRELQRIQNQIGNVEAQMNAIGTLINNLNRDIAAQQALIARTQATIDDLSRQIRFGEADLTGTVKGTDIKFTFSVDVQGTKLDETYTGTVDKDSMKGKVDISGIGEGTFTAKRQ